jgi:hypothetical protein
LIATRAGLRVWVATQPIDFRRGVHGLVALVAQALCADPLRATWYDSPMPLRRADLPTDPDLLAELVLQLDATTSGCGRRCTRSIPCILVRDPSVW